MRNAAKSDPRYDGNTVTVASPGLGATLVDALDIAPGERVLDIAAGAREATVAAATRGAAVTTAVMNADTLPFRDGQFDVAMSCVGIMFADRQQRAADELLRVVRPGGRIGLLAWTPSGMPGRAFARLPVAQAWATGASSSPLWGLEAHLRDLLGDGVDDLHTVTGYLRVDAFDAPDVFRRYVSIGRTPIAARLRYAETGARRLRLSEALDDIAVGLAANAPMEWEYRITTATVRTTPRPTPSSRRR